MIPMRSLGFTDDVRGWFESQFSSPTSIQLEAWERIRQGDNTLVIAPTGSGKTLAAFLMAINRLSQEPERARGVRVLYVSPLKALGADVERNLQVPLQAIGADVTMGIRTGDTPQSERAKLIRNPPDILITTPESLYLMLTSRARETLKTVDTVIVDEIHSMAGSKRGAHFSLSMERLDSILKAPAQRIGLSATVKPVSVAAAFLGGIHPVSVVQDDTPPAFSIRVRTPVDDMTNIRPVMSGTTEAPDTRTGSASIWPYIEGSILNEVLDHRSTIVFVNSRGICERLTAHLNDAYSKRLGLSRLTEQLAVSGDAMRSDIGSTTKLVGDAPAVIAKAHHGSVSKDRRLEIERELKSGELKCVVATSSLELGIDMGEVDLVIQVAAPLSVSSGLQRIGRANHQVGGKSQAIIYPRTRFEVLDAAFEVEGMMRRDIEETALVKDALDVLAQQTAAEVAMHPDGLSPDAWLTTVRKSACYEDLGQASYASVLDMLAGAFASGDAADFAPRLAYDRTAKLLTPIPRTQKLAVSAAGTIPDRGLYPVMLNTGDAKGGRARVGELDEEMVHESRVGDVIILGTSTWRITQITNDRVLVSPAPGRTARLPFWHGDGQGRALDEGKRRGEMLSRLDEGIAKDGTPADSTAQKLQGLGLDDKSINNLSALIALQRADTQMLPGSGRIVVETCPDDTGASYVIIHSPFGKRVHEPWALALSRRIQEELGFDPQCAASDDGIVMRMPSEDERPLPVSMVKFAPDELADVVVSSVTDTSLFAARFRECAARALLMRPSSPGRRTPLWQQRLRGGQMLEAVRQIPDFPIFAEAVRECLADVYDLSGACWLMEQLECGAIKLHEAQTASPSPFAASMLFGYVADHLYDDDMPHAERTRALLSVDPALLGELLGTPDDLALLQPEALAEVQLELARLTPDRKLAGAEGAAELLRKMGPMSLRGIKARLVDGTSASSLLDALSAQHRACLVQLPDGEELWAMPEDALRLQALVGANVPDWTHDWEDAPSLRADADPACALASKYAATHALISAEGLASWLHTGVAAVEGALRNLKQLSVSQDGAHVIEQANALIREADLDAVAEDALIPHAQTLWCTPENLRRLRKRSRDAIDQSMRPVAPEALERLVLQLQGVTTLEDAGADPGAALADALALFEGFPLAPSTLESIVLANRVPGYRPSMLDDLLEAGDIIWQATSTDEKLEDVRLFPTDSPVAPQILDATSEDMANATGVPDDAPHAASAPLEKEILELLVEGGPSTLSDMIRQLQHISGDEPVSIQAATKALEHLMLTGRATCTTFQPARHAGITVPASAAKPSRSVSSRRSGMRAAARQMRTASRERMVQGKGQLQALSGNWLALTEPFASQTELAIAQVESILDVYGVACQATIAASGFKGGMQALYTVLRSMEDAGEVIRGEFVSGLGASQFARRHIVEALRSDGTEHRMVVLEAEDPAMLYGDVLPWPDTAATTLPTQRIGCTVVLASGSPVIFATKRLRELITFTDDASVLEEALSALMSHMSGPKFAKAGRNEKLIVEKVDGQDIFNTPVEGILKRIGLIRDTHGMRLLTQPF
ncbi:MAG: DEAD/DEAH box helicase [Eggerthellaceae bacterium]|nr:DEAD/DEAH box helicase [Eggerthellaceae bacterium]